MFVPALTLCRWPGGLWMPVYEFICEECATLFERLFFGQPKPVCCPECGSPEVRRKPSTFGMSGVEKQTSSSGCTSCSASSCAGCKAS